jgi:formylglycine-generating enzyme required for sulfatase activity
MAYAAWLSGKTGENWRLPTDEEWAFAAGERFTDDALALANNSANPAARWLARYRAEAGRGERDPAAKPWGHFGANGKGVSDMAGNVWEWTTTCYARSRLASDGSIDESTANCGVRVLGGRHRAYMSTFLHDGKSGGCAAGMAPDNLGIRLVRDRNSLFSWVRAILLSEAGFPAAKQFTS